MMKISNKWQLLVWTRARAKRNLAALGQGEETIVQTSQQGSAKRLCHR